MGYAGHVFLAGVGSVICWVIGDGYSAGGILVGANDSHRWCLAVFGVCRGFLVFGVMVGLSKVRGDQVPWSDRGFAGPNDAFGAGKAWRWR